MVMFSRFKYKMHNKSCVSGTRSNVIIKCIQSAFVIHFCTRIQTILQVHKLRNHRKNIQFNSKFGTKSELFYYYINSYCNIQIIMPNTEKQ